MLRDVPYCVLRLWISTTTPFYAPVFCAILTRLPLDSSARAYARARICHESDHCGSLANRMVFRALTAVAVVWAASCAARPISPTPEDFRRDIVLAVGASQRVPDTDLTVSFEAVVEDSRCPTGVTCVWAGDASISIRIDTPSASPARYTLHTGLASARAVDHGRFRVGLVTVDPYPAGDAKPRPEEYRATLVIEAKPGHAGTVPPSDR
jgi:hypothetical protein